ncbi:MAG: hypothetical protein JWN70_1402 [Planctomycetaceae bacterium]|nr:hypothetical protein [Planctomycetaceae bacterium]
MRTIFFDVSRIKTARLFWCLTVASLAAINGCAAKVEGPERFQLNGTVTFQGKPVPAGEIRFDPDSSKNNSGPGGVADIKAGKYTMRPGMGIVGGPHVVRIFGYDGQIPAGPEKELQPLGKPIFPTYQTALELPKESATQDFDVPATGK